MLNCFWVLDLSDSKLKADLSKVSALISGLAKSKIDL